MIVADKIEKLCKKNGLEAEVCQVRITDIEANLSGTSLIVPASKIREDYGVPVISGMPYISGAGVEKLEESILKELQK